MAPSPANFLFLFSCCAILVRQLRASEFQPVVDLYSERIVGGVQVKPNELPYQVTIQENGRHFCGGVIYNENYIITAAHCVQFKNIGSLRVVAGEHSLVANDNTEQTRSVSAKIVHDDFDRFTLENDIALLELSPPLDLNSAVEPIRLPEPFFTATGVGVVSGWGRTMPENGELATILRKVSLPIQTDAQCREAYGSNVKNSMICAGFDEGGKDACQGDSGGPLAVGTGDDRYLAGIVSWGKGCAFPDFPGVYTEVSHFIDFIEYNATK